MKWKPKRPPLEGDIRYITKFAWLPVRAIDLEGTLYTVWLETYEQVQVYMNLTIGLREYHYKWMPRQNNVLFGEHE